MDIEKRQADRRRVLRAIFEAANGSETELVRIAPFQQSLELSEHEVMEACHYLVGEHLLTAPIKVEGGYIVSVQITHQGVKEIERSLQPPASHSAQHFPRPISVVNVHGNVIGSAIQSGSTGAHQDVSVGDLDLEDSH
jgi:hypothetical protein